MTVSTQYQPFTFKPGAAMSAEAIPWQFLAGEQIVVTHIDAVTAVETVLVLGDDYSIGGSGPDGTGSVTALAAWPVNDDWRIERATLLEQEYELPPFEALRSSALERENDRQLMALQEQDKARNALDARAVQVAKGVVAPSLPMGGGVGNKVVGWNAPGTALIPVTPGGADAALRDDLASELGGEFFIYNDGGAEAESISGRRKLGQWLHVEDRGVTALSSAATNFIKFTDIFGVPGRGRILLDGITYDLGANSLVFGLSNVWVKGVPKKTKLTCSAIGLISFLACTDVVFEDIIFECTNATAADDFRGVINLFHAVFRRIRFINCYATAPNCGINGLKVVVEDALMPGVPADGIAESIWWHGGGIENVGRMAWEFQNHAYEIGSLTQRYFDIQILNAVAKNTGLTVVDKGMGVSLSGYGSDCKVDSEFDNNSFCCIENVGASSSKFSGRSKNLTRMCAPISFTNNLPMRDNTIEDFKTLDIAMGEVRIRTQIGLITRGNVFKVTGSIDYTNCSGAKSWGDSYETMAPVVVYVNGAGSVKCLWRDLDIDHSDAGGGAFAAVRFDNGANGNLLLNTKLIPAASGQPADNTSGAYGNWLDTTRDIDGYVRQDALINTVSAFPADANAIENDDLAPTKWAATTVNVTSAVALTAARTLTLPQKMRGIKRIRNSTTGAQDIVVQASIGGATVNIANGAVKAITQTSGGLAEA